MAHVLAYTGSAGEAFTVVLGDATPLVIANALLVALKTYAKVNGAAASSYSTRL